MADRIEQASKRLTNWFEFMVSNPQMSGEEFDTNIATAVNMVLAALLRCDTCNGTGRVKKGAWVEPTFVDCPDHHPHVVLAERKCKHDNTGPCGLVRLGSGDAVCPGGGVVVLESEYHASQYGDEHDVIVARLDDE